MENQNTPENLSASSEPQIQNSNPVTSPNQNAQTQPITPSQQFPMSASQMGINEPKNKLFDLNPKKLLLKSIIAILIIAGIFGVLVFTNVIALSEFKTLDYTNSEGAKFKVSYYTKHTSKELKSGNIQLVSKISKDGKFPLAFSIANGNESGYNRVKDCTSYEKVLDVQNTNLNQKISVCDLTKASGQNTSNGVYAAGFTDNNQFYVITIAQDYADIDLSSQSGAKDSLTKFGMEPYENDIQTIVSSIKPI